MFLIFIRACKKYGFDYLLHTVGNLAITLHPKETFGFIKVEQAYYERNYFKLFLKAIMKMRTYRKEGVYH